MAHFLLDPQPSSSRKRLRTTINTESNNIPSSATQRVTLDLTQDSDEDDFDGSIDWGQAFDVFEESQSQQQQKQPANKHISGVPKEPVLQSNIKSTVVPAKKPAAERPATTSALPLSLSTSAPTTASDDPRQIGLPKPLQFNPSMVKPTDDGLRLELIRAAAIDQTLDNGWTLLPHQKRAVLRSLVRRRHILALDMGLGKTLIGCVYARSFLQSSIKAKPIVVCPVSLQQEWRRTLQQATGLETQAPKEAMDPQSTKTFIASWGKIPQIPRSSKTPFILIADEAHSMQSMTAARTQDVLTLTKHPQCRGVLLLTGTPMKNGRPANLFPLLVAVQHPLGNHQLSYEAHFCAGRRFQMGNGRSVWDAKGSSNLDQLQQLISSHLLHLTKAECLKELPPQTREFPVVPLSHRHHLKQTQALQDLARVYRNKTSGSNDAVLRAVGALRLVTAWGKVDATVAHAQTILKREPAVVIFTSFVEVARSLHKRLSEMGWQGELLTGETPAAQRQSKVDNFQQGLSAVFVATFGAGGVGLTLTAAHSIILIDRPWTPGEAHQAEDRVRRIGQTHPVTSYWMTTGTAAAASAVNQSNQEEGSAQPTNPQAKHWDAQLDALLAHKAQTAQTVLSCRSNTAPANTNSSHVASTGKLSMEQLIQCILVGQNNG